MSSLTEITSHYGNLSLAEKFYFFDADALVFFEELTDRDISKFLKIVILDESENSNIRKQAIEIHTEYVLLQKLKPRYELNILIDEWSSSQDPFLEIRRLKDLFLFYEEDPDEIEEVYRNSIGEEKDTEIQSESYFCLGLIDFLKAIRFNKNEAIISLQNSYDYFLTSSQTIENRTDADFFSNLVSLMLDLLNNRYDGIPSKLKEITKIIWERTVFSLSEDVTPFEIGFYRVLYSFSRITESLPSAWLDYREEFSKLYYYYSEIQNLELKKRLSKSSFHADLSEYFKDKFIEPYFALNLTAERAKIRSRMSELDSSSSQYEFLSYLYQLANNPKKN